MPQLVELNAGLLWVYSLGTVREWEEHDRVRTRAMADSRQKHVSVEVMFSYALSD